MRRIVPALAVAAAVVVVDQLTKHWALQELQTRNIDLFWTLRFNLVFNEGTAFSLGSGLGWVFGLLALGVSGLLLRWAARLPSLAARIAVGAVVGGALGNLIDRAFRDGDGFLGGRVVDFVDLQWWPVFNVADVGIVLGAIALVVVAAVVGDEGLGAAPAAAEGEADRAADAAAEAEADRAADADADERSAT